MFPSCRRGSKRTQLQTHAYTRMYACLHPRGSKYKMYTQKQIHACMSTHTYTQKHLYARRSTCNLVYRITHKTHIRTHTYVRTSTYKQVYTRAHTRIHLHLYTRTTCVLRIYKQTSTRTNVYAFNVRRTLYVLYILSKYPQYI